MQQHLQNKKGLVQGVFDKVFDKYDLMNDFMSFGIHRLWKKNLINMMGPSKNKSLIDVACGTGDIGKLYLDNTDINNHIACIDPNKGMVTKGKEKLKNYKKAETNYEKALKLDPENKIALEYQGELFVETDRLGLAQVNLNKLKELCPTSCDELEQLKKYINQEAEKTL